MSNRPMLDDLFGPRIAYPDVDAQERLARLVGLDEHKARLTKMLSVLVSSAALTPGYGNITPAPTAC
jgi:hypothetical protein